MRKTVLDLGSTSVENGKPNGLGVLISTNGWKYFGSWKNGEIWNGTEYDKDGNHIQVGEWKNDKSITPPKTNQ